MYSIFYYVGNAGGKCVELRILSECPKGFQASEGGDWESVAWAGGTTKLDRSPRRISDHFPR